MNLLAIRTLEAALEEAHHGIVDRNAGHRLALAWLASQNAGLDWHYASFWRAMADGHPSGVNDGGKYVRTTRMRGLLDYWRRELGVSDGERRGARSREDHPAIAHNE
jgi:hypothetical protein